MSPILYYWLTRDKTSRKRHSTWYWMIPYEAYLTWCGIAVTLSTVYKDIIKLSTSHSVKKMPTHSRTWLFNQSTPLYVKCKAVKWRIIIAHWRRRKTFGCHKIRKRYWFQSIYESFIIDSRENVDVLEGVCDAFLSRCRLNSSNICHLTIQNCAIEKKTTTYSTVAKRKRVKNKCRFTQPETFHPLPFIADTSGTRAPAGPRLHRVQRYSDGLVAVLRSVKGWL